MGFFYIEKQRTGYRIAAVADSIKSRSLTIDHRTLDNVGVLIEERKSEDTKCGRIGLKLLNDQVVILTGLDVGTVFAQGVSNIFERLFIGFTQSLESIESLGTGFHG